MAPALAARATLARERLGGVLCSPVLSLAGAPALAGRAVQVHTLRARWDKRRWQRLQAR